MSGMKSSGCKLRRAFSLVELVVVVLIVGILAAVAAPKMFDTSTKARESATKASLSVVRNAIELYYSEHNVYPTAVQLVEVTKVSPDGMKNFIKGPFPVSSYGKKDASVLAGTAADSGTTGWVYDAATGSFWVNDTTNFSKW